MLQNLSEIVIEAGLATAEQLRAAARLADKDKVPLVVALVQAGGIGELELVTAIAKHTRFPAADPAELEVDLDAARQVPYEVCQRLKAMPLSMTSPGPGQRMRVAMADPTDAVAVAEIEHRCGCAVSPVIAPLSTIDELIARSYRELVTEVMARRPSPTSAGEPGAEDRGPTTQPHVRISDAASLPIRLEALVRLLQAKGVIEPTELDEAVAALLEERPGEA